MGLPLTSGALHTAQQSSAHHVRLELAAPWSPPPLTAARGFTSPTHPYPHPAGSPSGDIVFFRLHQFVSEENILQGVCPGVSRAAFRKCSSGHRCFVIASAIWIMLLVKSVRVTRPPTPPRGSVDRFQLLESTEVTCFAVPFHKPSESSLTPVAGLL